MMGSDPTDGRRAAKLVEALASEVTLIDRTGKIISSTAGAKGSLGYEPSFWRSRNVLDLAHPDDVATANHALQELLADPGGSRRERFRAQHIDGHWEMVEVYGTNLLDDPDVEALVLSTRTVAQEERLKAANEEAARTAKLQAEYVANLSNNLRVPLQSILGVAELLEQILEGEAADLVAVLTDESNRLRRVIDDIIDYAKVAGEALELDPTPTDVRRLVAAVATVMQPLVPEGVELVVDVDTLVNEHVVVDGLRLQQILHSLAHNACRLTEAGSITISLTSPRPDHLTCTVSDTGTGVSVDDVTDLFQPFKQATPTRRGTANGKAPRLSVANRLVTLMGGNLKVESHLGVGSTFSFSIPAKAHHLQTSSAEEPGSDTHSDATRTTERSCGRALVVDDSHVNQVVIGRQLESIGFDVEVAENGRIGVDKATSERFQMVIMDWHMPELDGLEATRRIRQHEATAGYHTPIVAMTASAMPGDREKCLDAGMDDFLTKPATTDQVAEAVVGQLRVAAGRASTTAERPDSQSSGGTQSVDLAVLGTLVDDLGDEATVSVIVETYLGDLDTRVGAIAAAVADGRFDDARREAHTLKSPSMMLGAVAVGDLCRSIEEAQLSHNQDAVEALQRLANAARADFIRWLNERSSAIS